MEKIFEAEDGIIRATTPSNPPSGQRSLYPKSDGWYDLSSAGVESKLVSQVNAQDKIYRATLTLVNGAISSTAVNRNDLSAAIVWTYGGEGVYQGTLAAAFVVNKTNLQMSVGSFNAGYTIYRNTADVVTIETFNPTTGVAADVIGTIDVQIIVAP